MGSPTHWYSYCVSIDYLIEEFEGIAHWAKMELPAENDDYNQNLKSMKQRLARRYPLVLFNEYRKALDPNDILTNKLVTEVIATPANK